MKSLKLFTLILILSCEQLLAQGESHIKQLLHSNNQNVLVAAHRGDWRNAPENSLQAYQFAIAMGVDIIEVDLEMSKDSVLIILHDPTINRSTTGKGKPSAYTLNELKKLHLRDGLGAPTAHTIPTLEEVMMLAKGKVLVNLDHSFPFYREAMKVLRKTGTLSQAIFKTEHPYSELKASYGTLLDSINFMPVVETSDGAGNKFVQEYLTGMKPVACEIVFENDTNSVFRNNAAIKKAGARIWVNSLWPWLCGGHNDDLAVDEGKTEESWGWLIAHGVNIIQTDRPQALLAYLRRRHLHH